MTVDADVIVVGSGPSGMQAAQTLVEAGRRVTLLDVGHRSDSPDLPEKPFVEIRRTEPRQRDWFLGTDLAGIPRTRVGAAPQVMPTRRHVFRPTPDHEPVVAEGFAALESHALGGLGSAWGAVSFPLLDRELAACGLPVDEMRASYERVARRIGVSGATDDLHPLRGPLDALLPPVPPDHNGSAVLRRYARRRGWFQRAGLNVGRPLLAMLSQDLGARRTNAGLDLDFWANPGGSVYRPDLTLAELLKYPAFRYEPGWLVREFTEGDDGRVAVRAVAAGGTAERRLRARRLVLAAGALGTARIVLRSLAAPGVRVPLVCNAHLYVPCLHLAGIGRPHAERCHSLAQVTMILDPHRDGSHLVQAQLYSYRSLLLFRLLPDVPLPRREALHVVRALAPALAIWAVEHEDEPSPDSFCQLRADGRLEVVHRPSASIESQRRAAERMLMRGMRRLGLWPIRAVDSGHGSSLHYGGQFPTSPEERPLTCDGSGRLRGTRGGYVADGAALRYLPAKGFTFTAMANADRIARHVLQSLESAG